MIEFNEFLEIIKIGNSNAKDASDKTVKIYNFFKSLTTGKFNPEGKELIFKLFISKYRREQILNSMMSKNPNEKKIGTKILNNYRNQLAYNKGREQIQNLGQDKGHLDGKSGFPEISDVFSTQPPEPDFLLEILEQKNDDPEDNGYGSDED
uniref:Uncharacterized protein n=1 Tax=Euplotes crassus TaxID=5936 RepID=A0A7S3KG64_EUPCR|mmetsp:Transcript_25469/g.25246  ORF Transcript_25469/g.25246 Transcript_25469/m.25246 type:complete len:151 (+) Transcript_25469:296-748(+)